MIKCGVTVVFYGIVLMMSPSVFLASSSQIFLDSKLRPETSTLFSQNFSNAQTFYEQGIEKIRKGEYEDAITGLSQSIRLDPNNPNAYYQRAIALYNLTSTEYEFGNWEKAQDLNQKAIADLTKAIQLNPNFLEAFYTRGLVRGARDPVSIQDFDQVIRLNPDLAEAYHNRGIVKFISAPLKGDKADWSEARKDFSRAIQLNSDLSEAYYGLGFCISGMSSVFRFSDPELIEGNPVFLKMLRLNPMIQPGNFWLPLPEDYQSIVTKLNQLIQKEPQNIDLYYRRGFAHLKIKDTQAAIKDFDTVIQRQPKNSDAYYGRGYSYYSLKKLKEAIPDLNKAIQIDPKNPDAYFLLGLVCYDLGDMKKSMNYLTSSIQLDPAHANAYFVRSLTRYALKDEQGAREDYWKARSGWGTIGPGGSSALSEDPAIFYNRGRILARRGDKRGALKNLQQAASLYRTAGNTTSYQEVQKLITGIQQ